MTELTVDGLLEAFTTMLGPADVDEARAKLFLGLALDRVSAIVSPVPSAARPITLAVAARAYSNPQGTQYQTAGPFSRTFPESGVWLLAAERTELEGLAARTDVRARGGFTIRPGGTRPQRPPDACRPS